MPRVISQDDVESGLGGMTLVISILVVLLGGAGLAIAVLLRRDNPSDSAFYDDDDDWDEIEAADTEKSTPVLPSEETDSQDIDTAAMALDGRGDISKEAAVETVVLPTLELPSKPEPAAEQKKRKTVKRKKKISGKDIKETTTPEADLKKLKKEKLAKKKKLAKKEKTAELMKLDIGDLTRKAKAGGVLSSGTKEEIIERLLR
jgi:hypothetical protein